MQESKDVGRDSGKGVCEKQGCVTATTTNDSISTLRGTRRMHPNKMQDALLGILLPRSSLSLFLGQTTTTDSLAGLTGRSDNILSPYMKFAPRRK